MKERPILMSAPMVRATLREVDPKGQTRRGIKFPSIVRGDREDYDSEREWNDATSAGWLDDHEDGPGFYTWMTEYPEEGSVPLACPYGQPGDRLWVRENGWERPYLSARDLREGADTWPPYEYDAEPLMCWEEGELKGYGWKRRPSIHMPRWASRIDLEVTGVRVERLQDISEADAWAEGCKRGTQDDVGGFFPAEEPLPGGIGMRGWDNARDWYADLWEEINGPDSWDANPWVWVVEFRRIKP